MFGVRYSVSGAPVRWAWGLVLLGIVLVLGCGRGTERESSGSEGIDRIVCGSPGIAEIVFAMGCGERVVGVSEYTSYPPEAAAKPVIGNAISPNRERLLVLKPDLMITQGKQAALEAFGEKYGIATCSLEMDDMADIHQSIATLAERLDCVAAGEALSDRIRAEIATTRKAIEGKPRKRVFFCFGRKPGDLTGLTSIGPGTFLDELITMAGGSNIFSDAKGLYPQVSKESLAVRSPEVILELHPDGVSPDRAAELEKDWARLPPMPAVEQGRIHYLTQDYLLIPGPRLGMAVAAFAEAIQGTGGEGREGIQYPISSTEYSISKGSSGAADE